MYSEIADIYHEIFPLNREFIDFIIPYLGPPGSAILDLGCGPGDYIHLFSKDHEGVGIDNDAEMIKLAKAKNKGRFFQMSFDEIDQLEGPFFCIYSIGNSLSYLSNDITRDFFGHIHGLLTGTEGFFIFQVVNWDRFKITGKMDFPVKTLQDGRTFHRSYVSKDENTVYFQTRLQNKDTIIGSWSDILFPKYSDDVEKVLNAAGFTIRDQFGDFQKSKFNPQTSPALILVARKR